MTRRQDRLTPHSLDSLEVSNTVPHRAGHHAAAIPWREEIRNNFSESQ